MTEVVTDLGATLPHLASRVAVAKDNFAGLTTNVQTSLQSAASQWVNVNSFGAKADGVITSTPFTGTDNTAAFNAALATGFNVFIPAGIYLVNANALNLAFGGQIVSGAGRANTIIAVPITFNQTALGVFVASGTAINGNSQGNGAGSGPDLRDFKIIFDQIGKTTLGSLNPYPPALYLQNAFNFKISRLRISMAMIGIDMRGDCGGSITDDLEISCFTRHIWIDGCTDTVRFHSLRVWPFDMSPTQLSTTMFQAAAVQGILTGRCDAMEISDSLFICGTQFISQAGSGGLFTQAQISNTEFDSNNGIVISGGILQCSNCYFAPLNSSANQGIVQTGGQLVLAGCWYVAQFSGANPIVQQTSTPTVVPVLNVTGGYATTGSADVTVFQGSGAGGVPSFMNITGVTFARTPSIAYTRASIHALSGCRVMAFGNQLGDKGTGAGIFIQTDVDDWHVVMGNAAIGWSMSFPTSTKGLYFPNLTGTGDFVNGNLTIRNNPVLGQTGLLQLLGFAAGDSNEGAQIQLVNTAITNPTPGTKYWRISSGGDLQLLNGAFSGAIIQFFDGGTVVIPLSGLVLGNPTGGDQGAGTLNCVDAYTNDANFLIRTKTALNNAASTNTATLTNAPTAGNPTKWISIDDNGTTRRIPAW